jgi:translocator protein
MKKESFPVKTLVFCFGVVFLAAFIGGLFGSDSLNPWHEAVSSKAMFIPGYIFIVVWTAIFFMIALSFYFTLTSSYKGEKSTVLLAFGVNLFLNLSWSFLFFRLASPGLAFFDLLLIWLSIILLFVLTYGIDKKATYLLIPYFLWVSFAGILNYLTFATLFL